MKAVAALGERKSGKSVYEDEREMHDLDDFYIADPQLFRILAHPPLAFGKMVRTLEAEMLLQMTSNFIIELTLARLKRNYSMTSASNNILYLYNLRYDPPTFTQTHFLVNKLNVLANTKAITVLVMTITL